MKGEIKSCLLKELADRLDPYMLEQGFSRGKSSLIYRRAIGVSTQKIDVSVQIHPKDNLNAAAAVYPQMEVLVPAVDVVMTDMIGDNVGLLEGVTGGTSKQPIGFMSEKAHTGRWFIYQPESVLGVVVDVKAFIERWTIPFLDWELGSHRRVLDLYHPKSPERTCGMRLPSADDARGRGGARHQAQGLCAGDNGKVAWNTWRPSAL